MSDASQRSALGVLVSCIVHAVIVLSTHPHGQASVRAPAQPLWLELRVEQRAPPPSSPARELLPPASRAREEASAAPPAASRRARSGGRPAPNVASTAALPPAVQQMRSAVSSAQDMVPPTPAPAPASRPPAGMLDLSPLAAARSLGDGEHMPLRDAGAARREEVPTSRAAQAHALAQQVPGLRASKGSHRGMEGVAVDLAEDAIYNVLRPWKLLSKTMTGSEYRYTGAGFDAAILPDGRVRFRDKDGLILTVMATKSRESGPDALFAPAPTAGLSLGDPRALWERILGKDPFAAERRRFLERTRALREYLAGRADARGTPTDDESSTEAEPEPQLEPAAPGDSH
jgi:hypothetical protein